MTRRILLVLAVAGLLLVPTHAFATVAVNDDIQISLWAERPSGQSQGPFWVQIFEDDANTVSPGDSKQEFLTFCAEQTQYFSPGSTYNIDGITTDSTIGKTLTGYTAWVYDSFKALAAGDSGAPWNQSNGPTATAPGSFTWGHVMNLYQNAVWAGMRTGGATYLSQIGDGSAEKTVYVGAGTDYETIGISTKDFLGSTWGSTTSGADEAGKLAYVGNYRVLNIQTGGDGDAQDQVFLGESEGSAPIPEPASLAIWSMLSLGAAAASGLARRRRRRGIGHSRWSDDNRQAILSVIEGDRHA